MSPKTWNLSQAPQACLCIILLVWVKCLAKYTLFLLQFGLVGLRILRVQLTRVSLHYKLRVSTTLHAALGTFTQTNLLKLNIPHKVEFYNHIHCFVAILRSLRNTNIEV